LSSLIYKWISCFNLDKIKTSLKIYMIKFKNISKRIGNHQILSNINLEINPQEFICLVGPSGAGKSMLLHILLGAEKPTEGDVIVDDYIINKMNESDLSDFRRKVGMVFQDYKLLPRKTVYENVAFALEVCGIPDEYIVKRVPEVLKLVDMLKHADKFPRELSGGEAQRTALARALVHMPKLLIADEPTADLDPNATSELMDLFLKINNSGTTIILATHNKSVVDKLKKRVVTLHEGKIVSDKESAGYND